jgi:hypothetical protein
MLEDNIILKETGRDGADWIHQTLAKDTLQAPVNIVMNLLVSKNVENFQTSHQLQKTDPAPWRYMG